MKIAIGNDHAGFELKQAIKNQLCGQGHAVLDVGTDSTASCDYPDYAQAACKAVLAGQAERAVLICGTGIGIAIAANKVPGIRCAVVYTPEVARLAREHNNAQAIAIGARFITAHVALSMIDAFLTATFETRHQRRIDKIHAVEKPSCSTPPT